jgi:hypothetical protein
VTIPGASIVRLIHRIASVLTVNLGNGTIDPAMKGESVGLSVLGLTLTPNFT